MRPRASAFGDRTSNCYRKIAQRLRNPDQKDRLATARALLKSRVCRAWAESAVQDNTNAKRFYVSGMVQGVGFRYFVERAARHLKLAGYVRNLRDGRVEAYAIGSAESLSSLRMSLERGPGGASVSGVLEEPAEVEIGFTESFSIEYDA